VTPNITKIETLRDTKKYSSNQEVSLLEKDITYQQANDYQLFLQNYSLENPVSVLHPLYARDPNILTRK